MVYCTRILFAGLLLTLSFSCSSEQSENKQGLLEPIEPVDTSELDQPEVVPDEIDEVMEAQTQSLPSEKVEIGSEQDEINESIMEGIPVEINKEVERWIEVFTGKHHDMFQRYLNRGEYYKNMIASTLRDQGVPTELYYLAMIESGFSTSAYSKAKAMGIWQFIKGTGHRYGLRIDRYVDERRDPIRATISAAMYLNDLNNVFDSWYLAMAAYNAGELRILRAIMKGKTRDFWQLARGKFLPSETMNYIPKFLAALTIGKNPEKYGFTIEAPKKPFDLVSVKVPAPTKLHRIAQFSDISLSEIKKHNPHLRRSMTPPGSKDYLLWLPKENQTLISENYSKIGKYRMNIRAPRVQLARRYHRVRRGETLASISKRYGISIRKLKSLNGIRSHRIYAGSRLIIKTPKASYGSKYRVRKGDNLNLIARKFNTSVYRIKSLNKLNNNRIYAGQLLRVRPKG